MSRQEDIKKLIRNNDRRLQILKQKKARQGFSADPATEIEIEDIEEDIRKLKVELKEAGGDKSPSSQIDAPTPGNVQKQPQSAATNQAEYYTYHVQIANRERIQVIKYGLDNQDLGQPQGEFRYTGDLRQKIDALVEESHTDDLQDGEQVKTLGEALFKALFDPRLGQDFVNFYEKAVHQEKKLLRFELNIDERLLPEVVALPWEFMRVPAKTYPNAFWLATAPDLIFSRRRSQWQPAPPIQLKSDEKLRIALVISAPRNLDAVLYEEILEVLNDLAQEQSDRIELLPIVELANARAIDEILEQRPHIFHFIGHGRLEEENEKSVGQIALVSRLKKANWFRADEFSELFVRHRPGVVLLQACESAAPATAQAFVGVASRVVQQNIPVVVAMQYEVSNDTASIFAMDFYERLAQDYPVDQAAQNGRRGIALEFRYTARDFATPVIFMRVKDGYLFERT